MLLGTYQIYVYFICFYRLIYLSCVHVDTFISVELGELLKSECGKDFHSHADKTTNSDPLLLTCALSSLLSCTRISRRAPTLNSSRYRPRPCWRTSWSSSALRHPRPPVRLVILILRCASSSSSFGAPRHPHPPVRLVILILRCASSSSSSGAPRHPHPPVRLVILILRCASSSSSSGAPRHPHPPVRLVILILRCASSSSSSGAPRHPHPPVRLVILILRCVSSSSSSILEATMLTVTRQFDICWEL